MHSGNNGADEPFTLFCLHYLGGSAREWMHVAGQLSPSARVVALDLPGFGESAAVPGYAVAEMAAYVARIIAAHAAQRWLIVGHSMGAKVAAVVARAAEDGAAGLEGLGGIVLVAGSPPAPEPMDEQQRQAMIGWFAGDPQANRAQAREYVTANSGAGLLAADEDVAVADALRAKRAAWVHWLEAGSREDWSARVGVLRTPALIIAGTDDPNLGPRAQRDLTAPHFAHARSVTLPNAKHLLPFECSVAIARLIEEFVATVERYDDSSSAANGAYRDLIASSRVSRATRAALTTRGRADDPAYEPAALDRNAFETLRALLNRVVPQAHLPRVDLAARIDEQLQSGVGDGWRFAALPPDAEAYGRALLTLGEETHALFGRAFTELDDSERDAVVARMAEGRLGSNAGDNTAPPGRLTRSQLRAWFDDVRADAVKLYMAHPATLARIGYSGIANGGDGTPKSGFIRIGVGEREAWEPVALPRSAS